MTLIDSLEELADLHAELGSPLRDCLRDPIEQRDIERLLTRLKIPPHPSINELYQWADGIDADQWYRLLPKTQPYLFPYQFFEPLARNVDTALLFSEELEQVDGWTPTWCPVFWSQTSGYVVDTTTPAGPVWWVGVDFASEERVANNLNELVLEVTDKFREGTYFFDPDHGIQGR